MIYQLKISDNISQVDIRNEIVIKVKNEKRYMTVFSWQSLTMSGIVCDNLRRMSGFALKIS